MEVYGTAPHVLSLATGLCKWLKEGPLPGTQKGLFGTRGLGKPEVLRRRADRRNRLGDKQGPPPLRERQRLPLEASGYFI